MYVRSGLMYSATSSTPTNRSARRPSLSHRTRGAVPAIRDTFAPRRRPPAPAGLRPQDLAPEELGVGAQRLLDAQQLVVLRDAVRARRCARLDLPAARRDGEVGDR